MNDRIRRTQAERREGSEKAMLKAAIDLIAREGVSAVTFEAVGREGGVSRGLPGLRFGSKAKLIEAVLRHLHEEQETLLAMHGLDDRPGREAIMHYVELALCEMRGRAEGRAYFRLLSWSVAEAHGSRTDFAIMHGQVASRLERWIRRGQVDGTIRGEINPAAMALMIGGSMLGLNLQSLIDDAMTLESFRETYLASLTSSLSKPA